MVMAVKLWFHWIRLIIGLEGESVLFLGETGEGAFSGTVLGAAVCTHILYTVHWTVQLSCEYPGRSPLFCAVKPGNKKLKEYTYTQPCSL